MSDEPEMRELLVWIAVTHPVFTLLFLDTQRAEYQLLPGVVDLALIGTALFYMWLVMYILALLTATLEDLDRQMRQPSGDSQ